MNGGTLLRGRAGAPPRCRLCRSPGPLRAKICDECRYVIRSKERNLVDNTKLREAVIRELHWQELSWTRAGMLLGYSKKEASRRLKRELGMLPDHSHGRASYRKRVSYEVGERICEGLGISPYEVGL